MNSKKRKGQYMPFNALKGYYESLKEVEEELEKEKDKELSEDKLEELNFLIHKIIENKLVAEFYFLENGTKKMICEGISRIDYNNMYIVFESKKRVYIKNIYNIII
jgi:hypothetical protein